MEAPRSLNALLQELQAVLPKALDVCGTQQQQTPPPGGGEDVVLSRLRTVLFALLHSCLASKPGARRGAPARGACCACWPPPAQRAPWRKAASRASRLSPPPHSPAPPPTPQTAVKQKETYSVLRVMAVVLERLPPVFSGGARAAALLQLLRLAAEPGAYASP
jgi:hypothetical protein